MKAAQVNKFGSPDVIEIVDVEKPKPQKGHVLVKVYASSVNPFDVKFSQGVMPNAKLPVTLGGDIAGVVCEIGSSSQVLPDGKISEDKGVVNFSVGNKVYGSANMLSGGSGAFAEFAAVPVLNIARMPNNLDFNQAAAVVLTGVSAVQAITEHFNLQAGQKILIHGGAGGIGTIAIQIAKHIGSHVATTATGQGIEYVKNLGADEVVDYKSQNFEEILSNYNAVFDTVGGEVYAKSFKVLKKGGVIVSMLEQDKENLSEKYGVRAIAQITKVNTKNLNILTKFIEDKDIIVYIDKIYSFDKIKEAFDDKETGDVLGKIVIEIQNN